MKKIIFGVLLGLLLTPIVRAGWGRLIDVDQCVEVKDGWLSSGRVCVIYDKLEKVNCYTYHQNYSGNWGYGSISCMKADK